MIDFLVSIANIFIDDIVTWQEEIHLGVTGGAGLHALSGCRVWNEHLGIIASVGEDVNPFLSELHSMGIDTGGLVYTQPKTNRAWQVFQPGDLRVEIMRDPSAPFVQAIPEFDKLPAPFRQAVGYHILWNDTDKPLVAVLQEIRQMNPYCAIVLEPSPADCFKPVAFFKEIFPFIDGFSPSHSEAQSILTIDSPVDIVREFLRMGCRAVALRMGALGSLAGDHSGKIYHVPIAEAKIVDVTGAGNAYAGGWLCGLAQHRSMAESLTMASVSASFELEQYGLCKIDIEKKAIRDTRYGQVLKQINMD